MNKSFAFPRREDWISSLVVFIIAMPLSLGIAIASGCTPAAGLITAVIGGIVAGALAGAPLAVTGPAAGLTALVFQIVQDHGIAGLAVITVLCGLLQFGMGVTRAGKVFTWIPKPVLEGVLSAIGLIIVLGQLHVLMGSKIPGNAFQSLIALPSNFAASFGASYSTFVAPALICGAIALAIQLVWNKAFKSVSWMPAALPAVVAVTLLSLLWEMPRVELAALLPVAQEATGRFFEFGWVASLATYLVPAIGLAVVASAESLLTARAIDVLASKRGNHEPSDLNRELIAQGTANAISGMIGGLPVTGVMVRSAANINAGGRTRWSTILHGVWIALFVGVLPFVLKTIPLTALAAVLILTGIKLINVPHLLHTLRHNKVEGGVWLFTAFAICATDLLVGLVIGILAYVLIHHKAVFKAVSGGLSGLKDGGQNMTSA